ncbi:hypothetical protein Poli38472_004726 [Pythium oligandrum]|uniref:Chromo domain-containing protein n=1 Tax=Pythium oligandrum TaxID=41045 RepID=A0A8K1FHE4_PYTOL|nr:hypothetical protein Poli38472_004726 [Pythium oligandrum]|eukprot:TMW59657.1 hypothetical protein Poli38472_004726 [Pythium oligandrum]
MGIMLNDVVLAYHGVMIYEAKVLKIDHGRGVHEDNDKIAPTSQTQYFVHYQGWHKKWDEWVSFDRILEDTPASRKLQVEAKERAAEEKANKKSVAKKKINTGGIDPGTARKSPFKKLKVNPDNDTEELPMDKAEMETARQVALQLPFSLKKQLVEDWKRITHEPYRLVPLPRKPCVAQIITNYLEFKKSKLKADDGGADEKEYKNIESIMEGIQAYFDRALSSILLYRFERQQYQEIKSKNEDTPLSQIYGAEHLIRLFVRLPVLLGSATIPERELSQIQPRLNDFLKYMQKHSASLFLNEYQEAGEKYVELAGIKAN